VWNEVPKNLEGTIYLNAAGNAGRE